MSQDLEALIEDHAHAMAAEMKRAVGWAESEEDIRHDVNKLIDAFIKEAGLEVRGRHEYGVAGGRIDSKYGGVVIEYKHPGGTGRLGPKKDSPGVRTVAEQIQKRFHDLETEEGVGRERILGVGCDGETLLFVRMRGKTLDVEDPQPVTRHTVERLLRAIVSLGARGISFTPDNLSAHFGAESDTAQKGVRRIHRLICETDSSKAKTFFRQWEILFGEVCGYDIHGHNAKTNKLAQHYLVEISDPAQLLFAVHTYYAIFIKLLAAEIVVTSFPFGLSILKLLINAPTSKKLRDEMHKLEQGGIWSSLSIRNFLEGDLFSWYLDAWNEDCAQAVRDMVQALDKFDPATLSIEPAESRDLLKQLYQQLFPKSVRHDLGEYYTPDWLADLTLDELGYDGHPDSRLLDPACGSGTFLVMAVNRVKAWFEEHRHECGFGEDILLKKILSNIIGFDLNPLAVMAARTNYLMAIRDLGRYADGVEIPIYLCDAIMTPSQYGELFAGTGEASGDSGPIRELRTSVGSFLIPGEVADDRHSIGLYADTLEFCTRNRYTPEEFLDQCRKEALPVTAAELHKKLFQKLVELDADNQNGVWARIIKNAFAPLFISDVDFVAGNPPWVNWESLPNGYRDDMKPLWDRYGLFTLSGSAARLGGGKKDLSMLFTYSAVDNYLRFGGRLGFVITQSIFKTQGAGDGFRQLRYRTAVEENSHGDMVYLNPLHIHDLSAMQVFEGATNRTAVFVCEKRTEPFSYPLPYTVWRGRSRIPQELTLDEVRAMVTATDLGAAPVDSNRPSSPFLTAPAEALPAIQKAMGQSAYRAYEGVNTGGLNGAYWIRVVAEWHDGKLVIENLHDVGRIPVKHVQTAIEPDLVYPLLRGRDVRRWRAEPSAHIILAQDPKTRAGIPESEMKLRWPQTYAYLKQFEGDPSKPEHGTLRGRSGYRRYFKPTDPFYSMYNVGPYTMAKWKVVWREQTALFQAALAGPISKRPVLPDHKLMMVPCATQQEAHYLLGMLNSAPCLLAVHSYVISTSTSTHVLSNVAVPAFSKEDPTHVKLADVARRCRNAAEKGDEKKLLTLQTTIDEMAAGIWNITDHELRAIQHGLRELEPAESGDTSAPDSEE